jgi:rhamnose transport system permease protein
VSGKVDVASPRSPSTTSARNRAPQVASAVSRYFRELCVAGALLALLLVLVIFAPHFYRKQALLSLVAAQMPALVVAIGITCVMLCRQIDISVGSQFGVCCVIAGTLAADGLSLPLVVFAAVAAGVVMGAFNGVLVSFLRLPSIVVTLATMVTWAEALRLYQKGQFINLPPGMQWFGLTQERGQWTMIGIGFGLVAAIAWALKNLNAGRFVYAVGSDAESARLAGIDPRRTTFGTFVFAGVLVGVAAVLHMAQSPQVDPKSGLGLELKVIAAAVVGGVAVSGGRGNLWGVTTGLVLLATVNPALTYLHVEAYWERAIQGGVILLAVVADGLRSRRTRT